MDVDGTWRVVSSPDFDFEGEDEGEHRFGEGEATLEGERLVFELWHYHGDEYTFYCERRE